MTTHEEQNEPMLRHDELAEQIGHMEPLAVGGTCIQAEQKTSSRLKQNTKKTND